MAIKIALAGNPNSGKTTMFNSLTGSSQHVGNWPGVTVEKKEGKLKGHKDVIIQDLPGIYSLSPYTLEEVVSRTYLINEKPDAIINIIDGTNIERNLYLTTQLMEIGIPMLIVVNMIDIVRKNGDIINIKKLSEKLGCEVVEASALKGIGSTELIEKALKVAKDKKADLGHAFSKEVEKSLSEIQKVVEKNSINTNSRWTSIKLFERDEKVQEQLALAPEIEAKVNAIIENCEEKLDDDSESIITTERYDYISDIVKQTVNKKNKTNESTSDKIDRIVTNKWLALPIFGVVMFLVYYISISTIGTMATDWVNDSLFGEIVPNAVGNFLASINTADWLSSLILDGIVAGVGAVLGFIPQMAVLFLCLAALEDCGYMARIAFIMDRIFRKFGLSGKSFIPILIGTGCGVPGIMASRTIENEQDRKMTIMTTTFIPCSAKLPVIALIAGALFPGATWVGPSAYFIGMAAIIISGIMLKKTKLFAGDPSPFVMELPAYHVPGLKNVLLQTWERSKSFIKKATTIILIATVLIWFLSSFSWTLEMVDEEQSILASLGHIIAPIFAPLGWGDWKAAVATITGLIAKENVVGTFGILYGFGEVAENGAEVWGNLQAAFTPLAAYSFLVFNLLCAPCFAAVGALHGEMKSTKWTIRAVAYQCVFAYVVSMSIYQIGMLVSGGGFTLGTVATIIADLVIVYLLFRKPRKISKSDKLNKSQNQKVAV